MALITPSQTQATRRSGRGFWATYANGKVIRRGQGYIDTSSSLILGETAADVDAEIARLGLSEQNAVVTPPKRLYKSDIRHKLRAMGKEEAFDAFFATLPTEVQNDYRDAVNLYDNDPMFVQYAPLVKQALGLTDEQFASLLN